MTMEVSLDAQCEAHFPDRCILCGCPGPGESLEERVCAPTWRRLLGPVSWPRVVRVPACGNCRQLLLRQRALRTRGASLAFVVAGLAYAVILIFSHGPYVNFLRTGGLVLFLAPHVIWEGLFPLPFRLRMSGRNLMYVFEHNVYGREFALINPESCQYDLDELVEHAG
jgi:hypothetical protein